MDMNYSRIACSAASPPRRSGLALRFLRQAGAAGQTRWTCDQQGGDRMALLLDGSKNIVDLRLKDEDDVVHHLEQEPAAVGAFYSDGRLGFHLENDEGLVYQGPKPTTSSVAVARRAESRRQGRGAATAPRKEQTRPCPHHGGASESADDPACDTRTMALISMRRMLDLLEFGYGVPAFNVDNLEQMRAIMEAADKTDSPVIVQASAGARKYAGAPFLRHLILAAIEIPAHPGGHAPGSWRQSGMPAFHPAGLQLGDDGRLPA